MHVGDVEEKPQEGVKKREQLGSVIRRRTLHILFEQRTLHSEFRNRLVTSVDATTRLLGGDSWRRSVAKQLDEGADSRPYRRDM